MAMISDSQPRPSSRIFLLQNWQLIYWVLRCGSWSTPSSDQ